MNDQRISDAQLDQLEADIAERFGGRWILLGRAGSGAGQEIVGAERIGSSPAITQHASSPRELLRAIEQREQQLAASNPGFAPPKPKVASGVMNTESFKTKRNEGGNQDVE